MSKRRILRVRDLEQQVGSAPKHPGAFLRCDTCTGEYSANAGDYFLAPLSTVLLCCGRHLVRVTQRISYKEV
jgi:hypothetical protein